MDNKYLLEIGVEELPASFIHEALEQLKANTDTMLKKERIEYENIICYATPRRLTIIIEGLADKQEELMQ